MVFLSVYYKHKQGGFNQRLYQMYSALAARHHHVHYVATEPLPVRASNIQMHILRAPFQNSANLVFWIYFCAVAPFFCMWVAWRHRVEKVVVFSSFYAFICILPVLLLRKKMVTFLRSDIVRESSIEKRPWLKKYAYGFCERIGLRLSSLVVPNSNSLMQTVSRRHRTVDMAVLPNNIEQEFKLGNDARISVRDAYNLRSENFVITTASRLTPVKNIGFLIEAFSRIELDTLRLLVIGADADGSGEGLRLQQLANKCSKGPHIVFTGWIEQPLPLIAASDLFVLPTLQEGSPNALLEALSCRTPCLGSAVPEVAEILKFDELLFPLDEPSGLAEKIRQAATDAAVYSRISDLSVQRSRTYMFDWSDKAVQIVS